MRLTRLWADRFRNLEELDLSFSASFVVFHGANAQGKTNLLEAIYLLANLRALRTHRTKELLRWGESMASLGASTESDGIVRQRKLHMELGRRQLELDGKSTHTLSDWFQDFRAIAFLPSDTLTITGEPARRRAWLDRAAFTLSPTHLDAVKHWNQVLLQKSSALRQLQLDTTVIDILNEQLAEAGARLAQRRFDTLQALNGHVSRIHREITQDSSWLEIRYRTIAVGENVSTRKQRLISLMNEQRKKELDRRMPLVGVHSDDLDIRIDDKAMRNFGSQGQIRAIVLSMKLAELLAAAERSIIPLFLIDDVGSELDKQRKSRLVGVLHDLQAQVFASTTDPDHLAALPSAETEFLKVESGQIFSREQGSSKAASYANSLSTIREEPLHGPDDRNEISFED